MIDETRANRNQALGIRLRSRTLFLFPSVRVASGSPGAGRLLMTKVLQPKNNGEQGEVQVSYGARQGVNMYRNNLQHVSSDRGLWFAFVSAVAAGTLVALFIAP